MYEFNKYEELYITASVILQDLITETLSKRAAPGRGYCENYHAGYLKALYRVEAAVHRQAYLFDIPAYYRSPSR